MIRFWVAACVLIALGAPAGAATRATAEKNVSQLVKGDARPRLVMFWASWCQVCKAAMPKLRALAKERPEVEVVFVNLDADEKAWKAESRRQGLKERDLYWGEKRKDEILVVDFLPLFYIMDKAGGLAGIYSGYTQERARFIEARLNLELKRTP